DLPGRAVEEVGAAHHVGDALQGIINDHGELIGEGSVAAPDDDVAALCECEFQWPLQAILERHVARGHPEARGGRARALRAGATGSGVAALVGELAPRAAARERHALTLQLLECGTVMGAAGAL